MELVYWKQSPALTWEKTPFYHHIHNRKEIHPKTSREYYHLCYALVTPARRQTTKNRHMGKTERRRHLEKRIRRWVVRIRRRDDYWGCAWMMWSLWCSVSRRTRSRDWPHVPPMLLLTFSPMHSLASSPIFRIPIPRPARNINPFAASISTKTLERPPGDPVPRNP